jgi:hypothetical protein
MRIAAVQEQQDRRMKINYLSSATMRAPKLKFQARFPRIPANYAFRLLASYRVD